MTATATVVRSLADPESAVGRLQQAIRTTDAAVLAVGRLVEQIVPLATTSSAADAPAAELVVTRRLQAVADVSTAYVGESRDFLARQAVVARAASDALTLSHQSARVISGLMAKSRILALNLRIEAARMTTGNSGLQAIGQEMVQFAQEVRQANDTILSALDGLARSVPRLELESVQMSQKAVAFSDTLGEQLDAVRGDVTDLQKSADEAARRVDERNRQIVGLANRAMSALQFHDPLVQELRALIAALTGDDTDLGGASVPRSVYGDTDTSRASGAVDLF